MFITELLEIQFLLLTIYKISVAYVNSENPYAQAVLSTYTPVRGKKMSNVCITTVSEIRFDINKKNATFSGTAGCEVLHLR